MPVLRLAEEPPGPRTFEWRRRALELVAPLALVVLGLFVFVPATIYSGNPGEISAPFPALLSHLLPAAFGAFALGFAIALPLTFLAGGRVAATLSSIGILAWIQANLLVWRYGLIGGETLDLRSANWRGWLDGALWLAVLGLGLWSPERWKRALSLAAPGLVAVQAIALLVTLLIHPTSLVGGAPASGLQPPPGMFEFSKEKNVVQIVMDELQSDVFTRIIESDPDRYREAFDGFVYFPDTLSVFPTTWMSIPALLTGKVYRNDVPPEEFLSKAFGSDAYLPERMRRAGFEPTVVMLGVYRDALSSGAYEVPVPYGVRESEVAADNASALLRVALFRSLPHFLKPLAYDNSAASQTATFEIRRHQSFERFFEDVIQRLSPTSTRPTYKFLHFLTSHYPAVMLEGCRQSDRLLPFTWPNIETQAKCAVDQLVELLAAMKTAGVYDNSLIVVSSDHGYFNVPRSTGYFGVRREDEALAGSLFTDEEELFRVVSSASSTILAKRARSRGPLEVSSAPASLLDVPATIAREAQLPEARSADPSLPMAWSVFDLVPGEARTRRYFDYRSNFLENVVEYEIQGPIKDLGSWRFAGYLHPPARSFEASLIDLGTQAALPFLGRGWGGPEASSSESRTYAWALGREASIFLRLPQNKAVKLVATVRAPRLAAAQVVDVFVDGKQLASWKVDGDWQWRELSALVPADPSRPADSIVRFHFSQNLPPSPNDSRSLALLFDSIRLEVQ